MKNLSLERLITICTFITLMVTIGGYFVSFGKFEEKVSNNIKQDENQEKLLRELTEAQIRMATILEMMNEDG